MKRMNFPHRKLLRRKDAELRNAKTPLTHTKRYRLNHKTTP